MHELGKFLVFGGVLMVIAGVLLWAGFGRTWLGRLPGDIHYSRGNVHFYFPIATCLILSAVLTLIMWLLKR